MATYTCSGSVSTATYSNNTYDVFSQSELPLSLTFANNGEKMYVLGRPGVSPFKDIIYEYTLSTPGDVSTASYVQSKELPTATAVGYDIFITNDGARLLYAYSTYLEQYDLTTPYDISTLSFVRSELIASVGGHSLDSASYAGEGNYLYVSGDLNPVIGFYCYSLSTAYDISSKTLIGDFDPPDFGMGYWSRMREDGKVIYSKGNGGTFGEYALSTPYDPSTAGTLTSLTGGLTEGSPSHFAILEGVSKLYTVENGASASDVYEYDTGVACVSSEADYYWKFDQNLTATNYITQAGSTFTESGGSVTYPAMGNGWAGDGGSNVQVNEWTSISATIQPVSTFTGDMTVAFWTYAVYPSAAVDLIRVSGISTSSSETENAVMVLNKNGATLTYSHEYGSGSVESSTMTGTLNYATLYHVMLIRDDTAKTVKLYIDGSLSDTFTYTNSCTNTNSGVTVTLANGFAADYDELKIWGAAVDSGVITTESTPGNSVTSVIESKSPVAYWLMSEAYDATVTDQVGSYDGTWSGIDATEDQATDIVGDGNAVITLSSGFGGFTATTPLATPESTTYTFSVFVNFASLTNAVLMEINGGSTNNTVLEVTSGGIIQVTRNSTTVATASSTVTTGTLYLIAVVEDATNTTIYVNGVEKKQTTKPTGSGTCTTVEVASIDSGTHSYSMGHAAFFNQALDLQDIIDIYVSSPNTPSDVVDLGVVSYWKFEETSGTNLVDTGGSNDLTIAGTYNLSQAGISTWGNTYAINFTDAGATDSSSELIDFGTGDFAFFAWIKPTGIGDGERQHIFASVGGQTGQTSSDFLTLTQLTAEPATADGVVAYADGTTWNPGSGEGVYAYYNSTWNKLG